MPQRGLQRGLTLLEFVLVAVFVAALVAFAAQRIAELRIVVERAAIERHVARMQEALAVRFAGLAVGGRLDGARALSDVNPLAGAAAPLDYAGGSRLPPASEREPGQWYFDATLGSVNYVPEFPQALEWPTGQPALLRWRVRLQWHDVDGDGSYDPSIDRVKGVSLQRLDEGHWR